MSDDRSTFETTRARLEDIVVQVRRKDVSLEQSLDMLEEAVRLVNQCNELIDQTSFRAPEPAAAGETAGAEPVAVGAGEPAAMAPEAPAPAGDEDVAVESFELLDLDGEDIATIEFFDVESVTGDEGTQASGPAEIEDDERS